MTFVTQFDYFKKSIDSIFYSTPQIFEEIMALRRKRVRDATLLSIFQFFTFAARI